MRRSTIKYWIASLAAMGTLAGSSGCDLPFWTGNSLSFALGSWLTSQIQTTSVEYRCFRDGVEVDCSELSINQP